MKALKSRTGLFLILERHSPGFEEVSFHIVRFVRGPCGKEMQGPLRPDMSPGSQSTRIWGPHSHNNKEQKSASLSLEGDPSIRKECRPADIQLSAL